MAHYRFKAKISDDMVDAMEIIKSAGKSIAAGHADKNAILIASRVLGYGPEKKWLEQPVKC